MPIPFGIEQQCNGVGMLDRLHLVEFTRLASYNVRDDGMDGCHVCFAAWEYAIGQKNGGLYNTMVDSTDQFIFSPC